MDENTLNNIQSNALLYCIRLHNSPYIAGLHTVDSVGLVTGLLPKYADRLIGRDYH